jgi:hypothetical protein
MTITITFVTVLRRFKYLAEKVMYSNHYNIINNFNDLITTFAIELNLIGWEHKIVEFGIYFFTLNFNDSLNIETKIYIN